MAKFTILDQNNISSHVVEQSETPSVSHVRGVHPLNMYWNGGRFVHVDKAVYAAKARDTMKVYRRAFRLALQQTPYGDTNLLVAIEAHVATLDPYNSVRMAWEDVTIFERNHPDMSMFSELGLTDEQIDDIFRLAQSIEAGA